jgi:hypothetical protein
VLRPRVIQDGGTCGTPDVEEVPVLPGVVQSGRDAFTSPKGRNREHRIGVYVEHLQRDEIA